MFREPGKLGVVTLYSVLALLSKETGVMVLPILAAWTWNPRRPAKQALPLLAKYALVVSQYTALNSINKDLLSLACGQASLILLASLCLNAWSA